MDDYGRNAGICMAGSWPKFQDVTPQERMDEAAKPQDPDGRDPDGTEDLSDSEDDFH